MSAPRHNLELKAVDLDQRATLDAALALGAHDEGVLLQRDTYFHAVQGRLKLREARVGGSDFVELEALVTGPGAPAAEHHKLAELQAAIGITDDRLVARSYADLLERRGMAIPRR